MRQTVGRRPGLGVGGCRWRIMEKLCRCGILTAQERRKFVAKEIREETDKVYYDMGRPHVAVCCLDFRQAEGDLRKQTFGRVASEA